MHHPQWKRIGVCGTNETVKHAHSSRAEKTSCPMTRRSRTLLVLLSVLWLFPAAVQAATVTYNLDYGFSPSIGTVSPAMAIVTLTDLAGGAVRFDVLNQAGANSKFDDLFFNFANGTLNPNQLVFSNITKAGNPLA